MQQTKLKSVLVPPDGGWGWVVCFAYALNNVMIIPTMQSFGLIFKETFPKIGLNMKDSAVIINTNSAFGMLMGLVNGSIIKKFGYRKGAVVGGILVSVGVILTAFADNFYSYLFAYGIVTSFGFGLSISAFSLALNSYFNKKRSRATGYGMTLTVLGSILVPFFISFLLEEYGASNCILLVGAMSLNSLVAAFLLQPLKWHMKKVIPDQETVTGDELKGNFIQKETAAKKESSSCKDIYGSDTPLPRRKTSLTSTVHDTVRHRKPTFRKSLSQPTDRPNILTQQKETKTFFSKLSTLFDLDLLTDPIFLNLMIGMSLAICAEINFALLTPFIMQDFGLSTLQIAKVMSTIATVDIVFKCCAPFIADFLNVTAKLMYMISLAMLILSRTALLFVSGSFDSILIVASALGISKGFRSVFMNLLIPNYVPLEKLASATGLQMVIIGIVNLISGPILGAIRDATGNYNTCLIIINLITFATLLMWTIEYIYIKLKKHR